MDTLIKLLPSEPKLTQGFGVSQGTIRRALDDLVLQGSLVRHQDQGDRGHRARPIWVFHLFRGDGVRELPQSKTLKISSTITAIRPNQRKL